MTIRMFNVAFLIIVLLLAGCGAKSVKKQANNSEPSSDITRPPEFVRQPKREQVENNPDETVSYDDWLKRRDDGAVDSDESASGETETPEQEEP